MILTFAVTPDEFTVFLNFFQKRLLVLQMTAPRPWHPLPFVNFQYPAYSYYIPIDVQGYELNALDRPERPNGSILYVSPQSRYHHQDIRVQQSIEHLLNFLFEKVPFIFAEQSCYLFLRQVYHELQTIPFWDWTEHFSTWCDTHVYGVADPHHAPTMIEATLQYRTMVIDQHLQEQPLFLG